jgi:alkanesulfonate monooxygenase SsuD/methylene tetrahydromethanopterin reductase-like flavin-dependent oxidoreductase (luciferase family)
LRPTALVAEEVACLAARHPVRVGLGVGAGALPLDFEVMGLDVADAAKVFKAELPRIVEFLRGDGLGELGGDLALQRCRDHPVTVLSAAVSITAVRRAAGCGAGLILDGMVDQARVTELSGAYRESGGTGPVVLIRRVWLGPLQTSLVQSQRRFYQAIRGDDRPLTDDQTIHSMDGHQMADELADLVAATGVDALNLRVHLPGITPAAVREQIAGLASDVLPDLQARLSSG